MPAAMVALAGMLFGATAPGQATGRNTAVPFPELPPRSADGAFLTVNHGIDRLQAVWHVRAALNVAALGCDNPALIDAYNRLLADKRELLAAAHRAVQLRYQREGGTAAHDLFMTRLYNYFSQPFVHSAFCRTAAAFVAGGGSERLDQDSIGALAQLEAPFLVFYERYAAYLNGRTRSDASPVRVDRLAYALAEEAPAADPQLPYAAIGD